MATLLSPAESLVMLKPNRTPARESVKVTLLWLLAQGLLRIEETTEKKFLGTRKLVYVRPTERSAPPLPPHAASLMDEVRAAQATSGSMQDVVARARQAYGSNLQLFNKRFILPALASRGLVTEDRFLLVFRSWRPTRAGFAEQSRIRSNIDRARTIPALLGSRPAEAAAIALAIGPTILLVKELRPLYRQLSDAMRRHGTADDADPSGWASPAWDSVPSGDTAASGAGDVPSPVGPLDHSSLSFDAAGLGGFDAGGFDLAAFDASAFDALDSGMASFDSGFDAASGGDSGGGDGGGGGGDGGGG